MNELSCGSALQTQVFAATTLQEVYICVLGLQIRALESRYSPILGIVVIYFNHIGCGVDGVLLDDRRIQWVWCIPWSCSGKVGAYAGPPWRLLPTLAMIHRSLCKVVARNLSQSDGSVAATSNMYHKNSQHSMQRHRAVATAVFIVLHTCGCMQRLLWCTCNNWLAGSSVQQFQQQKVCPVQLPIVTYIWPHPFLSRIERHGAALPRYSDITAMTTEGFSVARVLPLFFSITVYAS